MYKYKIPDCIEKLNNLFERSSDDFNFVDALCDVLIKLETESMSFEKTRRKFINDYYDINKDGTTEVKSSIDKTIVDDKMTELQNLAFDIKKKKVKRPDSISPKELYYLRDFFIFEES